MNDHGNSGKFDLVEIVILIIFALANDVITVAADLSLAIPVIGMVLVFGMGVVNAFIFGAIILVFVFKMGFSSAWALRAGVTQIGGGVAQFFGIPARTITVIAGILMVNIPALSAAASLAKGDVKGAEGAVGAIEGEAAQA